MDEIAKSGQAPENVIEIEYLPYLPDEKLKGVKCQTYPLSDLSALGLSVQPLMLGIQNILGGGNGGSGIYYVNTGGKTMFQAKDGAGFIGSLSSGSGGVGGGQARLAQMACDPTMFFMSAALMNIEKKLDSIKQLQQEMMDFLKAKEKAEIRGNINTLIDIVNNYKFNWNNKTYKYNKQILVQDIRREAEQSIILARDQILDIMHTGGIVSNDRTTKSKLVKYENEFTNYQLALYEYAFASLLEILLLENFSKDYLKSMADRIEELELGYRELYTQCYNQLETTLNNSVQYTLASGFADLSKGLGEMMGKIPLVNKGRVDEALQEKGQRMSEKAKGKAESELSSFPELSVSCTRPFIQAIRELDQLYNEPKEIYFDNENLYFVRAV